MAIRTTELAVKGILLDDYDTLTNPSLTPFILTASIITDRIVTCATSDGYTLTTDEKELIERWLSAHFYVMSDQNYSEKRTADAQGKFQGITKMRLEASKYGQTALILDPSGCLESLSSRSRASAFWLGKPVSDQIAYENRD